jgi:hypothetical protein
MSETNERVKIEGGGPFGEWFIIEPWVSWKFWAAFILTGAVCALIVRMGVQLEKLGPKDSIIKKTFYMLLHPIFAAPLGGNFAYWFTEIDHVVAACMFVVAAVAGQFAVFGAAALILFILFANPITEAYEKLKPTFGKFTKRAPRPKR